MIKQWRGLWFAEGARLAGIGGPGEEQDELLLLPPIAVAAPSVVPPEQGAMWIYPQPEFDDERIVFCMVIAKRCDFGAEMYFIPRSPGHLAGITAYYNTRNWHYLHVTTADDGSPALRLLTRAAGRLTAHPCDVALPTGSPVVLRAEFDGPSLSFGHDAGDGFAWLPYDLDATILSDEHADEIIDGQVKVIGFTGAMLGLWVQDLDGSGIVADFAWSSYAAKP